MKRNTKEVWDQILADGGSVQGLDFVKDWWFFEGQLFSNEKKAEVETPVNADQFVPFADVFKTFKEINQLELVKQAGLRQQYVDQAVSLNLAFPTEATPKFINQVHMEAYKQGIKTLYYMRTESVLRGDIAAKAMDENCLSCDG
jgi:ribonucleoside-diphosphate reductase alpha chain